MKFEWKWDDFQIENFLKDTEREYPLDCIAQVRTGNLCFDLVERENEPKGFCLWTDLYVGGEDTGYGYGINDYPYDFCDDVCHMYESKEFCGMEIDSFKAKIEEKLNELIYGNEKKYFASKLNKYNIFDKANEPLKEW
jgi:hypothetical protein